MARRNRSLTGFDEVSSDYNDIEKDKQNKIENNIEKDKQNDIENDTKKDIKKNTKNETLNNSKNSIDNNIKNNSKLDDLLSGKKEKKNVPTMLHLEPEVAKVLDKISGVKKGRSGKKSQIVNEVLKEIFRSKGLMD